MAPHIFMGNGFSRSSLLGWPGVAALAVLALDQLTKFMVYTIWPIPGENELVVIPGFFSLVHWRNLGAAWGIFARHTWLLAVVSLVGIAADVGQARTETFQLSGIMIPAFFSPMRSALKASFTSFT